MSDKGKARRAAYEAQQEKKAKRVVNWIFAALVLLAGYLLVGAALPVWSARRGDKAARAYRQTLADTNSYMLENLRGLRDTLQYQDTANRAGSEKQSY